MATETKRETEKRLGQRPMRGPSCWWSLGKPRLFLLDRSSELLTDRQAAFREGLQVQLYPGARTSYAAHLPKPQLLHLFSGWSPSAIPAPWGQRAQDGDRGKGTTILQTN